MRTPQSVIGLALGKEGCQSYGRGKVREEFLRSAENKAGLEVRHALDGPSPHTDGARTIPSAGARLAIQKPPCDSEAGNWLPREI